jgi:hypothetical protein
MSENDGIFLQFEQPPKTVQVATAKSHPAYLQQHLSVLNSRTIYLTNFGFTGFG